MNRLWLRALAVYLPAGVLLVAFLGVCVQAGTPWPWHSVVHEDGQRTFLETIFYFEHATRELLLDAILALGIAGAVRSFAPTWPDAARTAARRRRFAAATVAALVVILGGTAWTDGPGAIVANLEQLHTREGAVLAWGAHWRYHFLERIADLALAFGLAGAWAIVARWPRVPARARRTTMLASALLLFVAGSVVFGVSAAPFRDPTYVGHELRELFTHALVTVPLALGVCLLLVPDEAARAAGESAVARAPVVLALGVAGVCGAFLLVASVMLGARSHGQKAGLAELLFPHFFEHALGYWFVTACAGWLCLLPARGSRGSRALRASAGLS